MKPRYRYVFGVWILRRIHWGELAWNGGTLSLFLTSHNQEHVK